MSLSVAALVSSGATTRLSSMELQRCESRGNPAQIAALSTNQAPTAIIGCLHMTLPFRTHPVFTIIITFLAPAFERPLLLCLKS